MTCGGNRIDIAASGLLDGPVQVCCFFCMFLVPAESHAPRKRNGLWIQKHLSSEGPPQTKDASSVDQVSIKYQHSKMKCIKMWANFPSIRISEESEGSLSAVSQLRSRQRSYSLASQLGLDSLDSWLWPHFQALRPYGPTLKGPWLFKQAIYRYVIGMSLWECYMRFRSCTFVMYTMYINRCAMCVSRCVQ